MTALPSKPEQYLHRFFEISLVLKAIFAGGEILAALGAFLVTPRYLPQLIEAITRAELTEDPRDLVANYLVHWAQHLSVGTQRFMALYLLSHGVIKLWVIVGLLRERLWYYPVALIVFGIFIIYQLYRFSFTQSSWLLVITAVDFVVVGLTWHEYAYLRRLRTPAS
ncbi:MAG TPA: DUF2127 domain-containing protein [Stellaceae bacterium]|nr:DUF2127 domain-containing protein [Stellaceae bacterium]